MSYELQRDICDPEKPLLSLSDIALVEPGMSVEEVHSLLDVPHGFYGSGVLMDAYTLEDESTLIINYGMYRTAVLKVFVINADGSRSIILE